MFVFCNVFGRMDGFFDIDVVFDIFFKWVVIWFENDKFLFSGWRNWNLKFENVSGLFNVE